MTPAALYGLTASALLAGALVGLLPRLPRSAALAATTLALVPAFAGESVAMWLHGAVGTPSFSLATLALLRCLGRPCPALGAGPRGVFLLAAGAFYGTFLFGFAGWDPYGYGYQPAGPLLAAILPFAAWLFRRGNRGWLAILGGDLLAYAAGLFDNAWDALFDPLLATLALIAALRRHQDRTACAIN